MIIGVDAREIQDGVVTGIGRSLMNFIKYFGRHDIENQLILFSEHNIPFDLSANTRQINFKAFTTFIWDQIKLPGFLKASKVDLFYSPYYKIPLLSKIPAVNQVLDLMYLVFPAYKKRLGIWKRLYYASIGRACSRRSISIVSDSRHAKQDIIRILKVDPAKIQVIPLGLADRYLQVTDPDVLNAVKAKFGLPDRFILYLGNFKPHKNVISLVRAFKFLEKKFPEHKLVLAGPLDENGMRIRGIVAEEGLLRKTIFTDTIREKDRPEALLSLAEVFVFPTLFEGFGLPPLEAMACGTAVVASNMTSVPEVVGEAAVLVNPLDINEINHAISDLIENPVKRGKYSKCGKERSARFRDKETAGKLYDHIIGLLEQI